MRFRTICGLVLSSGLLAFLLTSRTSAAPENQMLSMKASVHSFHGTPLSEVVDALRTSTGQNIFVHWKGLESAKVTRSLPVTVDLSDLTLGQSLDRLLAEVGGEYAHLGYTIDDGVITISTQIELAKNVETRVYDVRRGLPNQATRQQDLAQILARVHGIDPLSWKAAGGEIGDVKELSGQLIVTQTPAVHQRIETELKDLIAQAGENKSVAPVATK